MWNKVFPLLWIKLQMEEKHFSLSLPISLHILQELLDCLLDLLEFLCLFSPKKNRINPPSSPGIHAAKELLQAAIHTLNSLTDHEPYDFVNITTDKIKLLLKIR